MALISIMRAVAALPELLLTSNGRVHLAESVATYRDMPEAECPCCGFKGKFQAAGKPIRAGAACSNCASRERHRLFALALMRDFISFADKKILHFAPEPAISALVKRGNPAEYVTADIEPGRADLVLDLERIAVEDAAFNAIIASHVLEHVNDERALAELIRILRPGGILVAMVPLVEGWESTFEDKSIVNPNERSLYFGQWDHVRYYGADFRHRVRNAGFTLSEFTAGPMDSVRYGLSRGEKVFLGQK